MQNSATSSFPRRLELTTNEIVQDATTRIPRSLFYLTCSALIVTFILLLVSLLDLGYCSLWLTPPLCVLTLIYFIGVLIVSRMQRTIEDPTYFPTVVFVGYILASLWLIASILTIVVFAVYPHMVDALKQQGLHSVTVGLQRFECFLCLVDFGIVGGFTLRSHVIAMEEGDPENWRVLVEKNETPNPAASRLQIRGHRPVNLSDLPVVDEPPRPAPSTGPPPEWVTAAVLEDNMSTPREQRPVSPLPIVSPRPLSARRPLSPGPFSSRVPNSPFRPLSPGNLASSPPFLSPRPPVSPLGALFAGATDSPYPQIQISSPPALDDVYDDYYAEVERRLSARRSRFDKVEGESEKGRHSHVAKVEYSDGDSIYGDSETGIESEAPSSPDRWSDEEEVEEEYKPKHSH